MSISVLVGGQWGDEGKGKIVDLISNKYQIVARYQGGANAGHTVEIDENKYVLHLIPAGIIRKDVTCIIGNGVVIDPSAFFIEIEFLEKHNINVKGRLFISSNAHIIMPYHKFFDLVNESGKHKLGTTGRGIGPCYNDKYGRLGIKVIDLLNPDMLEEKIRYNLEEKNKIISKILFKEEIDVQETINIYKEFGKRIKEFVIDSTSYLNKAIKDGKSILLEGAQGTLLDIDHGTYPFVTSSSSTSGGACIGTGIPPTKIDDIIGVVKAYTTRVGEGPFPTELLNDEGEKLRKIGNEFGATTGRPRRCGWFDAPLVKYSVMINGIDEVAITKLDVLDLFDEIKVCTGYEVNGNKLENYPIDAWTLKNVKPIYKSFSGWKADISKCRKFKDLPVKTQNYLNFIAKETGMNIKIISVGPKREQTFFI